MTVHQQLHLIYGLSSYCGQDDSWVILLEGWCRIRLQAAPKKLPPQGFVFLNVKQLGPSKNDR